MLPLLLFRRSFFIAPSSSMFVDFLLEWISDMIQVSICLPHFIGTKDTGDDVYTGNYSRIRKITELHASQ